MADQLEQPNISPMRRVLDSAELQHKEALAAADNEIAAVMKRMESNKRAMEKGQGTEDYWRFALAYDVTTMEYKNAWLSREQCKLRHDNHVAKEFIKQQMVTLDGLAELVGDLMQRLTIAEKALGGEQKSPVEASYIISAYQQGILRERARKAKETTNQGDKQ